MINLSLTQAKYDKTYLGKVGGPDGPPVVVTVLKVGEEESEVNLVMDVSHVKSMIYNSLQAMRGFDLVSDKLYKAFTAVFEAGHENLETSSKAGV